MAALHELRTKVNSKILAQFNGKPISILGKVKEVHPNGSSFDIEATDGGSVTAIMTKPLSEPLSGWVEVRGEAQGRCHVTVHNYLLLRDSVMEDFDKELFDDLITTINSCDNPFTHP